MTLEENNFYSRFAQALPGEVLNPASADSRVARAVEGVFYTPVEPTPVSRPQPLLWSKETNELLCEIWNPEDPETIAILTGNQLAPSMRPFASRYGGHQFGAWANQLGDGRAIILGETNDIYGGRQELQLKGAGPTRYSRRADGRAVLRSSVREFLCSEAMHFLGVPTTRALSCTLTGEEVVRDMFYDGHPEPEPGAIVTRVAPSFIRFGHFELPSQRGDLEGLKKLTEFTVQTYFPDHQAHDDAGIVRWLSEVGRRTRHLMLEWTRVGFVHGVMNTDNMSILGLTIDYGPYGWLESYDPHWTPNTTDSENRRYRYGQQVAIGFWNYTRLVEAFMPLMKDPRRLEEALDAYHAGLGSCFLTLFGNKLGLTLKENESDFNFLKELDLALQKTSADFTIFYRELTGLAGELKLSSDASETSLGQIREKLSRALYPNTDEADFSRLVSWVAGFLKRFTNEHTTPESVETAVTKMAASNPFFVLRNYLVQEALDHFASEGASRLNALHRALKTPYEVNESTSPYYRLRPEWAKSRPGCSMLSCSS